MCRHRSLAKSGQVIRLAPREGNSGKTAMHDSAEETAAKQWRRTPYPVRRDFNRAIAQAKETGQLQQAEELLRRQRKIGNG